MRKSRFSLPSPAMVVALTALFVALGGTGYAASQLSHSQASKPGGGGGGTTNEQIKQEVEKLAPTLSVASAKSAGHARTTTEATEVDGLQVRKIHFVQQSPDGNSYTLLNLDGLRLTAYCDPSTNGLYVDAYTTVAGAAVSTSRQTYQDSYSLTNIDGSGKTFSDDTGGDAYTVNHNLSTGTSLQVSDPYYNGGSENDQIEYANDHGDIVTVNLSVQSLDVLGSDATCLVSGVAIGS